MIYDGIPKSSEHKSKISDAKKRQTTFRRNQAKNQCSTKW